MPKRSIVIWSFALFAAFLLTSSSAVACECLGIWEFGPYHCTSTGCSNYYTDESCGGGGCIYGENCYISGYGSCCGHAYETWNVNKYNCSPSYVCDNCGLFMSHATSQRRTQTTPRVRRAAFVTQYRLGFSPEAPLLVPDHCRHTYRIYSGEPRAQLPRASGVPNIRGL